jgi:ssDNA-binding Zn-finger/Zn-ribbon topoisomerase 1
MTAIPTVLLSPVEADQVRAATENCPTWDTARRVAFAEPVEVGWSSTGNHPMSHDAPLTERQFLHLRNCGVLRTDIEVEAADRTENCSTCHGFGRVPGGKHGLDFSRISPCPDCSGKRPGVVTLVVEGEIWECDHGTRIAHHWSPPSRWAFDGQRVTLTVECPVCDGLGHFCDPGHGTPVAGCPDCSNGTVPLVTALVTVTPAGDGTHWNVTLDTSQEGL